MNYGEFKVWDEINESEEFARCIESSSAFDAACRYAEDDIDGQIDRIYANGHPICVRDHGGTLHTFLVTADYAVTFHARLRQ